MNASVFNVKGHQWRQCSAAVVIIIIDGEPMGCLKPGENKKKIYPLVSTVIHGYGVLDMSDPVGPV